MEWESITEQIDGEFGTGVTKGLLGGRVPVALADAETRTLYIIPVEWVEKVVNQDEAISAFFELRLMGIELGQMAKSRFFLSLQVLPFLQSLTENILVVSSRGAEAFTYGKSILKESVVGMPRWLKRGQRVLIVNEDRECIGIAALALDAERVNRLAPDKLVAKNLADIGWYIRRLG
ncbi:MAG: PUA domain-containing protein [Candidatus Thorarchaeota archaeon]|nr:MAG: hypothetical protein DRP09_08340 [Candidatus Thorarchaeota archaeon]